MTVTPRYPRFREGSLGGAGRVAEVCVCRGQLGSQGFDVYPPTIAVFTHQTSGSGPYQSLQSLGSDVEPHLLHLV